jgi:hypothetical protein
MAWLTQRENVAYALQRSGSALSIAPVIYAELAQMPSCLVDGLRAAIFLFE